MEETQIFHSLLTTELVAFFSRMNQSTSTRQELLLDFPCGSGGSNTWNLTAVGQQKFKAMPSGSLEVWW